QMEPDNSAPHPGLPSNLPEELHQLLLKFLDVFATPSGLPPPPQLQNHAIPLLEGSNPVKVRPYRYPHS
ncbi:hypothetical protein L195_g064462, partial [Trifolium pratense]